jgi:hypothetical protein
MTATLVSFLLIWLLLWAAMCWTCVGVALALDCVAGLWQRHQRAKRQRQAHRADLARINRQTAVAVQRMYLGFALAQKRIHDEAIRCEAVRR